MTEFIRELLAAKKVNKFVMPSVEGKGALIEPKPRKIKFEFKPVLQPKFVTLPPLFSQSPHLPPHTITVGTTVNIRFPYDYAEKSRRMTLEPVSYPIKEPGASLGKAENTENTGTTGNRKRRRNGPQKRVTKRKKQVNIMNMLTKKRRKPVIQCTPTEILVAATQSMSDALHDLHEGIEDGRLLAPLICEPKSNQNQKAKIQYPIYEKTFRRPLKLEGKTQEEREIVPRRGASKKKKLDTYIRVPRAYGLSVFPNAPASASWHTDLLTKLEKAPRLQNWKGRFTEERPHQQPCVDHVTKMLETLPCHSGILDGDCGCGKTCMGLYLAHYFGYPTMVFVHSSPIAEQWAERIPDFLPDAKVGFLQGQERPDADCDICIAMIHTVIRLDRKEARQYRRYGLLLTDECHHIAAQTFSETLRLVSPAYMLGLSATPERNDGLDAPVEYLLGPQLCHLRSIDKDLDVQFVRYVDSRFRHVTCMEKWRYGQMDYVKTISKLVDDMHRTKCIADLALQCYHQGRHVLIIAERVCLITNLLTMLPPKVAGHLKGGKSKKVKAHNKNVKDNCQIVLGSFKLALEGLDIPRLDTMIIGSPLKYNKTFKQPIGRIQRGGSKHRPLLIDFYDCYQMFKGMMYGRRRYYDKKCYTLLKERVITKEYEDGVGGNKETGNNTIADDDYWRGKATQAALQSEEEDELEDFGDAMVLVE